MPTFNPFWEHFLATYKLIFRTCRGRVQVCLGSERTTKGTGRLGRMQVLKNMMMQMRMMTWWNATRKKMTWQRRRITGRHLARRSRGITMMYKECQCSRKIYLTYFWPSRVKHFDLSAPFLFQQLTKLGKKLFFCSWTDTPGKAAIVANFLDR